MKWQRGSSKGRMLGEKPSSRWTTSSCQKPQKPAYVRSCQFGVLVDNIIMPSPDREPALSVRPMPTSKLSLKSVLDKAGIRRSQEQRPLEEARQDLDTVVASLLETVFSAIRDLQRSTAGRAGKGGRIVTQPWSVEIELLWFLLISIMRGVARIPEMGPDARDSLHSALLESFISQIIGYNRLAPAYSDQRGRLVERLEHWYGQALEECRGISRTLPSADALSLGDSVCGRAARRMAAAQGAKDNLPMELALASWIVEVWLAIDLPKVANLCAQIHLSRRSTDDR